MPNATDRVRIRRLLPSLLWMGCALFFLPTSSFADSPPSLQQAHRLIEEDHLDEANQILETLLTRDPDAAEVRWERARLLAKMGRPKEAVTDYDRLYQLTPLNHDLLTEYAWTLMQAGFFNRAAPLYRMLLQENPTAVDLHLRMAMALYGSGDVRGTIHEYKTVLDLDPSSREARIGLQELQALYPRPFHLVAGILLAALLVIVLVSLVVMVFLWMRSSKTRISPSRTAHGRELYIQAVALVSLIVASYYILWRLTSTMNWDAWWFSVPVFAAELYGVMVAYMFFFMVWRPIHRRSLPPLPGRTVDVFITTYDEAPDILRKTILGSLAINYPHETYVLDDGHRVEIARLAKELGCRYIAREKNIHAKAGNLNNALRLTAGEFIVTLDADHVPLPHFIDRLIGYFSDPAVAFVQTPQDFYNVDSFQHRVNPKKRKMWTEQSLFFSVIQPGKDYWNAAFFCGSCAMLRRDALKDVGGFAEATVTEDLHTSILIHAKGYRSVYHNESLAYGLAPATTQPFHVQRLRWGQGAMQVLVRDNPLWIKGLTWPQRISYLASITTYFDGFQKLTYYLAPVVFFMTGILPIAAFDVVFLLHFIPYFGLFLLSFELMSRGHGSTLITEQYNMVKFSTFIKTSLGLFTQKRLQFRVTPKSHSKKKDYPLVYPQILVLALNIAGMGIGTFRYFWRSDLVFLAYMGNLFWAIFNTGLASTMVRYSLSKIQFRSAYRFLYQLPCTFSPVKQKLSAAQIGLIRDCHETGASLITAHPIAEGLLLRLSMTVGDRPISVEGAVIRSDRETTNGRTIFRHGIRFTAIDRDDQDFLTKYSFEVSVPKFMQTYNKSHTVFERLEEYLKQEQRRQKRLVLSLPTTLRFRSQDRTLVAVTDDISEGGLSVIGTEPFPPSESVEFAIDLADQQIQGAGKILRRQSHAFGNFHLYRYVIQFQPVETGDIKPLKELHALLHPART